MPHTLLPWLQLALTPNLGPAQFYALLAVFKAPEQVSQAPAERLAAYIRNPDLIQAIHQRSGQANAAAALAWEAAASEHHLISARDPRYAFLLQHIPQPPPVLFAHGNIDLLNQPAIAVVGSRQASAQGLRNAHTFAQSLAQAGWVVVSGLAAGIDTAAHQGALSMAGPTIAVLGTSIDGVYPRQNRGLAQKIAESGLLLSEFPLGTAPLPANFPRRNRIIAGLSLATLVVEASLRSGSLITAHLAASFNREVMALPGAIHNPYSQGCNKLLQEGAKLVTCLRDIEEELPPLPPSAHATADLGSATPQKNRPSLSQEEAVVLQAVGFDPIHVDALIQTMDLPTATVHAVLLSLELAGYIATMAGGRIQRCTLIESPPNL